jgi:AraC-like DNA-binding protein
MSNQEPSNYFEYMIRDADSYQAVLSGANVEISQLEPGRLSGRHVRLDLPGGQFSCVETNLPMRGTGTFPNLWTLSVILECKGRSLQHGLEVRAGSLLIHGPGAEHDGVYGRDFKIVCFSVRDEILAKHLRRRSRQLQNAVRQPWSVFDPPPESRQEIIAHFGEAAAIVQSDPRVRTSDRALEKFQDELVCAFMEAVAQQFSPRSIGTDQRAAAMMQLVDQVVEESPLDGTSVVELCAACKVPRRTLNRTFQDALGMGPATYLRRVRLNRARRALQRERKRSITVTDVALDLGFWHLGRFAEQYNELFGESPHETLCRTDRGIGTFS